MGSEGPRSHGKSLPLAATSPPLPHAVWSIFIMYLTGFTEQQACAYFTTRQIDEEFESDQGDMR